MASLAAIVQPLLPEGCLLSQFDILGKILRPDGSFRLVRSSDVLRIPSEPAGMVTGRTVALFLDPASVAVTVIQGGGLEI
jgi:hypothetical protein